MHTDFFHRRTAAGGLVRAAALALFATLTVPHPALADQAHFPICKGSHRVTCVVDGDTVWLRGEKIRLEGIDAPEISEPKCASEFQRGMKARDTLQKILNGTTWTLTRSGADVYGRTLGTFHIGHTTAGRKLVGRGLARGWTGHRMSWCGWAR